MIDIRPEDLRDHESLATEKMQVTMAEEALKTANAAHAEALKQVSTEWDSAKATAAASGDVLAGAERHAAAVMRANFAARIVTERERDLAEARAAFAEKEKLSWIPVLRKGREIRRAAAKAYVAAEQAKAEADALALQGTRLLAAAHSGGLRHFDLNAAGRGARSEAAEEAFLTAESAAAEAFFGRAI
jgi:hypothetical protein